MGLIQLLRTQHQAGTLQNTYTTAKSVINSQAITPIPPGFLQLGDTVRVRASGGISNIVTSQPTFTFQVMMGTAQPSNIIAFTTGAITTTTTAHTLIPFEIEIYLRLDSEGSGTAAKWLGQACLRGIMWVVSGATADLTDSMSIIMAPNTAPAVGTGFDSTVLNYLDFFVGISASSASNGIQIYQYTVEYLSERN